MTIKVDMNNEKFIESFEIDEWEIETSDGWKDITHIHKTIKYNVWKIKTKNFELKCADEHIVFTDYFEQIFVKDLKLGDWIYTKNGYEEVTFIQKSQNEEHMYDVTVNSDNHSFWSNGILSHNTTISTIFITHYLLFSELKNVAILANREKTAVEIINKVKMAYRGLPLWLQQGVSDRYGGWTKTAFGLENGCKCVASSTAAAAIRGMTISLLFLDEFAFVPQEIADDFFASVYPTITRDPNAKIVIVSTPNGLNHFYDIYKGAVSNENNFRPIKVNWWEVDGQDEEWKKKIIRDIGPVKFNQEYNGKFLGSSSTLIDSDVLERINPKKPIATKYGDLMQIFELPQVGKHHYVLGIDSAGGTGGDYSIVQVLKVVSHTEVHQVATYASNMVSPHNFAEICIGISDYYLKANMIVENNEMGGQVADKIWYDFECDRVLNTDPKGIGTRSTRKSKLIANMLTKRYIEEGWLKLNNAETVRQFGMYEEVTPNVFRGPRTDHDDHVTSIIWGLYYLQTPYFEGDLTAVRRSINEVYKIIPDEEADRAMLKKKNLSTDRNINNEEDDSNDDEGYRPPISDDDEGSFEWPNDLDD